MLDKSWNMFIWVWTLCVNMCACVCLLTSFLLMHTLTVRALYGVLLFAKVRNLLRCCVKLGGCRLD